MSKTFLRILTIVCLSALTPCIARASINISIDPEVGDSVKFSGTPECYNRTFYYGFPRHGYYGGPFIGKINGTETWNTFCVEAGGGMEFIAFNTQYYVAGVDSHVASATMNYVSDESKWLYWQYGNGSLPTTLAGGETWTVNDLQLAIWHGVHLAVGGVANPNGQRLTLYTWQGYDAYDYYQAAEDLYELAEAALDGADPLAQARADSVWVMNPTTCHGTNVQSMLYASIDSQHINTPVPEPATILVWALLGAASWLGMGVARRGRRIGRRGWPQENRSAILDIIEQGRR